MKDEAIKKINKFGSVSSVIVTILKVLVCICVVACIGFGVFFAFMPKDAMKFEISDQMKMTMDLKSFVGGEDFFATEEEKQKFTDQFNGEMIKSNKGDYDIKSISFPDNNTVEIDMNISQYDIEFSKVQIVFIISSLFFAAVFASLIFVGRFCKQLKVCESPFAEPVIKAMKHMAFSLIPYVISDSVMNSILNSFFTNKAAYRFDINLGMLAAVILIFAMTFVFKYGAKLQQESDETL